MADGTLRIEADIHAKDKADFLTLINEPGTPIGVARLKDVPRETSDSKHDDAIGQWWQSVVQSGFFGQRALWYALGSSDDYFTWLATQKSALSNQYTAIDEESGQGYCDPCHRREIERGSGTAIKPDFWGIPLTHAEHLLSHEKGDSEIGNDDWWGQECRRYIQKWAMVKTKELFNVKSFKEIEPQAFIEWAQSNELKIVAANITH